MSKYLYAELAWEDGPARVVPFNVVFGQGGKRVCLQLDEFGRGEHALRNLSTDPWSASISDGPEFSVNPGDAIPMPVGTTARIDGQRVSLLRTRGPSRGKLAVMIVSAATVVAGLLWLGQAKSYDDKLADLREATVLVEGAGQGSGFVCDWRGYVVTAAHMVPAPAEGESTAVTVCVNGGKPERAIVLARYPDEDVAILKLADWPRNYISLDEAPVREGDEVIVSSLPLGLRFSPDAKPTLTFGQVGQARQGGFQMSAPVHGGSSGGPVVNKDTWKVAGIVKGGATDAAGKPAAGLAWAIDSSVIRRVLKAGGYL